MPYIEEVDTTAERLAWCESVCPTSAGELNWAVSTLMVNFLLELENQKGKAGYGELSSVAGAVSDAVAEFRRRVMDAYEDEVRARPRRADPYRRLQSERVS